MIEPGRWRPGRGRVAVVSVVAVAVLASGVAAAIALAHKPLRHTSSPPGAQAVPVVSIGAFTGKEPAVIDFSADGGDVVKDITWSSWTATSAQGLGKTYFDNCVPDCAGGATISAPAGIVLSTPVGGRFTVMRESRAGATTTYRYPSHWPLGASGTVPTVTAGQQTWTSAQITITPRSLGAVTIGMTLAQASAAAGEPLHEVGDAFAYPGGANSSLYVGGIPRIRCLGASRSRSGPDVVTRQGFPLGGTLAKLKATYGTSLVFVPQPAGGFYPVPGYLVAFPDGNLAFIVFKGIVTKIEAGPGVQPSSCVG